MPKHSSKPSLLLINQTLRVQDNPALTHAISGDAPLIALYVFDTNMRKMGGASKWWLHHSLVSLHKKLETLRIPLILKKGDSFSIIQKITDDYEINGVYWNREYDSHGIALGKELKQWADRKGLDCQSFNASLLHEPSLIKNKQDGTFKVFSPFWKTILKADEPLPNLPIPKPAHYYENPVESDDLNNWCLLPKKPDWAHSFFNYWQPGEDGAHLKLSKFLSNTLERYKQGRDFPDYQTTSLLSPHLRFGEISPRQIWHAVKKFSKLTGAHNADKYLSEIGWREFSHYLLFYNPNLHQENFNKKFNRLEWNDAEDSKKFIKSWQQGLTGYPLIDAGMRELWQTGYMHNRVRMVAASFLVKHLLIDWREGEKWFWDTLVDACPANNAASWQWVAGTGADAAPYFRIFNPVLQSQKFDPEGNYIRRFVPELNALPVKLIHAPWEAKQSELSHFKIELGKTYPYPIIDHKEARNKALAAFENVKNYKN